MKSLKYGLCACHANTLVLVSRNLFFLEKVSIYYGCILAAVQSWCTKYVTVSRLVSLNSFSEVTASSKFLPCSVGISWERTWQTLPFTLLVCMNVESWFFSLSSSHAFCSIQLFCTILVFKIIKSIGIFPFLWFHKQKNMWSILLK